MAIDKKISYEMQGGVRNYLGKQPEVQAPRKWQSSPDKPATELAYITKAEKDLILKANIHGGLEKGPNMGPSGIMSLDSFGDAGGKGMAGGDVSRAETGDFSGFSGADKDYAKGLRAGAVAAGARSGPNEDKSVLNQAKALQKQFGPRVGTNKFGFLSPKNIFTGLLGLVNPAFGLLSKAFANIDLQGLRGYDPDGTPKTQEQYEKDRKERQLTGRLDNLYDRKLSGKNFSQKNIDMLESMGVTTSKGNIKSAIDRDIAMNPEMPQFATSYLSSLTQPNIKTVAPMGVNVPTGIETIDVGYDDPAFTNDLMAKLNNLETREYNNLKTGNELNMNSPEQNERLEELEQKKNEANIFSGSTAIV